LITKEFPHLTSYRYERKQQGRGENIIFSRLRQDSEPPAIPSRTRPALTGDDVSAKELLIQDLMDFSGHEQSRPFYAWAVYALDSQTIYRAISETKDEYLQGKVKQEKARLLNVILQRLAREQGIALKDG
jgi:hypothetical protein